LVVPEEKVTFADGTVHFFHTVKMPFTPPGLPESETAVLGVAVDITDQKRIEGELRQAEERFRLATEAAGMFAWEGDLATGTALWSANASAVIGCRPEELPAELSRSHFFIAPEDSDRVVGDYIRALAVRRDTYSTEYRGACELSSAKFFRSDTRILYDANGVPVRILGVTQDITERKVSEEALRESEDRFRGTFENAEVGMAHVAPDGHWLRVNHRLCEITGYSREELREKTFGDLTHPDDLNADWALARQVLAGEIPSYALDKRYFRKDGSIIWVSLDGLLGAPARWRARLFHQRRPRHQRTQACRGCSPGE